MARGVVLGVLLVARLAADNLHLSAASVARVREGLGGWDAGWYRSIATGGYGNDPTQSLRFFPLYPDAGRLLHDLTRIPVGASLLIIANVSAFVAGSLLVSLVRRDVGDERVAGASAWILSLSPAAFVLVMGYSDALLLAVTIAAFRAARTQRWRSCAIYGLAAGWCRPVGVLLALPIAIEALIVARRRSGRTATSREDDKGDPPGHAATRSRRSDPTWSIGAVVAPVAGMFSYMVWTGVRFGDFWAPLRVQTQSGHRGAIADPVAAIGHLISDLFHGRHLGTALHLPWIAVAMVLTVVALRRLPLSYGCYAAISLIVALSSTNLDSFERYMMDAFPLSVAAGTLIPGRKRGNLVVTLLAAVMGLYSMLAFTGHYVP